MHKYENTLRSIQQGNAQIMEHIPNMFRYVINYENALQKTSKSA
jgi:hypothetical protein